MKVRYKENPTHVMYSDTFNTTAVFPPEVIVTEGDSCYIRDLDVWLEMGPLKAGWKDMILAFHDRDIIPDNGNVHFMEPRNDAEQEQGYYM